MPIYRLSPLAEEDLYKITSTTMNLWSNEQAKVYGRRFIEASSIP